MNEYCPFLQRESQNGRFLANMEGIHLRPGARAHDGSNANAAGVQGVEGPVVNVEDFHGGSTIVGDEDLQCVFCHGE